MNKFISIYRTLALTSLSLLSAPLYAQDDAEATVDRAVEAIEKAMHRSTTDEDEPLTPLVEQVAEKLSEIEDNLSAPLQDAIPFVDREAVEVETSTSIPVPPINEDDLPEQPTDPSEPEAIITSLEVVAEPVRAHSSITSPNQNLTLYTPWKPKPLQEAPQGWRYIKGTKEQAYPTKITLSDSTEIQLEITPYILAPEDSSSIALVSEPGYQPELGYSQTQSISATLNHSNQELEATEKQLDSSIELLNQLLISLPR